MLFASGSGLVSVLELPSLSELAERAGSLSSEILYLRSAGDLSCPFIFFEAAKASEVLGSRPWRQAAARLRFQPPAKARISRH